MRVAMGPLPSAWVLAWAVDASEAMRQASQHKAQLPFAVDDEFFARNRELVSSWVEIATQTEVFAWEGDSEPDVLLTVIQYWRNLAEVRRELIDVGATPMPVDAERFSRAVRRAILDALVASGRMTSAHADRLEASWPVLSAARDGDVAQHEGHAGGAAR